MECMVVLLSFKIFNIRSASMYLPEAIPTMRTCTVKPVYLLEKDPDNPYFSDAIEKCSAKPGIEELANCPYFQYYAVGVIAVVA